MGNRLEIDRETIIAIIVGALLLIIIPIIINIANQKIKEHRCDTISITEAWKDDYCREYFKRDIKE